MCKDCNRKHLKIYYSVLVVHDRAQGALKQNRGVRGLDDDDQWLGVKPIAHG